MLHGGMLAYRLDRATTIFAAIGPVAATQLGGCRSPAPVSVIHLITVRGAGHQWPGSVPPSPLAARLLHLDQPSTTLDATKVIWRFFAAHPR